MRSEKLVGVVTVLQSCSALIGARGAEFSTLSSLNRSYRLLNLGDADIMISNFPRIITCLMIY